MVYDVRGVAFSTRFPLASCVAPPQVATVLKEGKMFAESAKGLVEVVSVNAAELALLPYDLAEGVYVVGTGSTGAGTGLGIMGELLLIH